MIKDQIMQLVQDDPTFAQAVDVMEQQVARMPIVPEDLDDIIALMEFVLQNPDKYEEVRDAAIKDGVISANMVPDQFDQVFVVSMLVALYGLQDRLSQRGFARGGLSVAARRLQTRGRGGDTELVHVNRREAEMLRRMGGAGTVNPHTGLHEYKSGIGKILSVVAPIALMAFAPQLGAMVAPSLTSAAAQGAIGGALIGAGTSAVTGGDPLRGAIMGGLSGGVQGWMNTPSSTGSTASSSVAAPSSSVGSTATGVDASQAAANSQIGQTYGSTASSGAASAPAGGSGLGASQAAANSQMGQTYATMKPSDAVIKSMEAPQGVSGVAAPSSFVSTTPQPGMVKLPNGTYSLPAGTQVTLPDNTPGVLQFNTDTGAMVPVRMPGAYVPNAAGDAYVYKPNEPGFWDKLTGKPAVPSTVGSAAPKSGLSFSNMLTAATAVNALTAAPPQVQNSIRKLSKEEQEIFNRPGFTWDWNRLQSDAAANNMDVAEYISKNWNKVTSGAYNVMNAPRQANAAQGGALATLARYVQGGGTGRSDEIDAKLSDGEYVMDAETVAMLGDGSNKAGARKLDQMRQAIRAHKGKALAKGKFSPNAKSPLAYLKEVA